MVFKAACERVAVEPLVARYAEQQREALGALDVELHGTGRVDVTGDVQISVRGLDRGFQRPVHRVPVREAFEVVGGVYLDAEAIRELDDELRLPVLHEYASDINCTQQALAVVPRVVISDDQTNHSS